MRSLCISRPGLIVGLLVCVSSAACAPKKQVVRAVDASPCSGARTVVVHNGTPRRVDVVLSDGGVSVGQVVEVLEPGQQSRAIPFNRGGPFVHVRDEATGTIIESRNDARLRFEYACQSES